MADGRSIKLRHDGESHMESHDERLCISLPSELKFFRASTFLLPIVLAAFAWIFGRYVIIFFLFVAFNADIPFWFRVVLAPVYVLLLLLGLYIAGAAIMELYAGTRLRFSRERLLIEKFFIFTFRKDVIPFFQIGRPFEIFRDGTAENPEKVVVLPVSDVGVFRFPVLDVDGNAALIETIDSFLNQYGSSPNNDIYV